MIHPSMPIELKAQGKPLDMSPERFGLLRESDASVAANGDEMRRRLNDDGYVFLRGGLAREQVLEVRRELTRRLAAAGVLNPGDDVMDAVAAPQTDRRYFMPELSRENAPLDELLYGQSMLMLFERIFEEPVRHFDFTWLRAVTPGGGTAPHCDVVYMGRGTLDLLTAWTPLGDIPLSIGGLMVLENSHRRADALASYLASDVDSYCENGPNAEKIRTGKMLWERGDGSTEAWDGSISHDPLALQQSLGGRWLTADYRAGDVLIFTMKTVHASLDNGSVRIRLSSDTRYQPASLPADERWLGPKPIAHSLAGKRGRIC